LPGVGQAIRRGAGAASWWESPDAKHTPGRDAAPVEYEYRVIANVDATLLSHA
jgi:hypothetical protein